MMEAQSISVLSRVISWPLATAMCSGLQARDCRRNVLPCTLEIGSVSNGIQGLHVLVLRPDYSAEEYRDGCAIARLEHQNTRMMMEQIR